MKTKIISLLDQLSENELKELYQYVKEQYCIEEVDTSMEIIKKAFGAKVLQEIGEMCIGTTIGADTIADFIKYRNEIQKPLETSQQIKHYIKELIKIENAGYRVEDAIDIMRKIKLQTINIYWYKYR